jgi:hypothetical protein
MGNDLDRGRQSSAKGGLQLSHQGMGINVEIVQ